MTSMNIVLTLLVYRELIMMLCSLSDLDTFPQSLSPTSEGSADRRSGPRKLQNYSHDTEVIFALPSLQMHLKTEHLQGEKPPEEDGKEYFVSTNLLYSSTKNSIL